MSISKNQLLIFTALFIALLFWVANPDKIAFSKYNFSLGQISDRDVIAPFDFRVYKNQEALEADRNRASNQTKPIYRVSENLKFNAQKNLDFIFQHFNISDAQQDNQLIQKKLSENGYQLSPASVEYLAILENRQIIYEYLTNQLTKIFNIGIYPASISADKIRLLRNSKLEDYKLGRLYSLEEAKENLVSSISGDNKKQIVTELADIVLIENIVIDRELTEKAQAEARDAVSIYSGRVQKNEKIVDKNQKVTRIELDKLNSLRQATKQPARKLILQFWCLFADTDNSLFPEILAQGNFPSRIFYLLFLTDSQPASGRICSTHFCCQPPFGNSFTLYPYVTSSIIDNSTL
jgi:membrane-associated HD superfamily phosphohydrolase